ncbi:glycogen debranching N-terminal domain-containing protein [Pseudarthrobacter sp. PH31-O2]|uniref:glycogen debranching N-terminal domain-containing protein n=1 Tax=Micrococcaceae TaxID=1268 RepID=UPI0024B8E01E|nr:glycogen debranching N-terminal domain-containing protein [Pseudarthrobacter sp. PH31-O2]MDJ0353042.1 glycogen debranching N-terminal domain-containing protein [Pseudarthrobacter sp. PH31-O2]
MTVQPALHRQHCSVAAPTQLWLDAEGRLSGRGGGAEASGAAGEGWFTGLLHGDTRMLCRAEVRVNGLEPEPATIEAAAGGVLRVRGLVRGIPGSSEDPAVELLQTWTVTPGAVRHSLRLATSLESLDVEIEIQLAADFTDMAAIRLSRFREPSGPFSADDSTLRWRDGGRTLTVAAPGSVAAGERLIWRGTAGRGSPFEVEWQAMLADSEDTVVAARTPAPHRVRAEPAGALGKLLDNAIDELAGLRLATRKLPDAPFAAAGAPWYFTLFGRDSLWAARLLLPLDAGLAAGTLRTLAAFQGTRHDPAAAEEPGKILHELRSKELLLESQGLRLPPVYYGTVDATPLWLCLLAELGRAGLDDAAVRSLLPNAARAVQWLLAAGGAPGSVNSGFLSYQDETGHGLSNQGWKDSADALQFRDGRLAEGPIALSEVQGYAYQAAVDTAALFDAYGEPGGQELRDFAKALQQNFRARFWVQDDSGTFPAMALDGNGDPLDVPGSNMGHLLGTGILDASEAKLVADRLLSPELFSGFGVHTISRRAAGFWPFSYHCGSVWSHDTAIAVRGLLAEGMPAEARILAEGLLAASGSFGDRLPELFAGITADEAGQAVPYPASCHPQAWSSAAAVVVAQAMGVHF